MRRSGLTTRVALTAKKALKRRKGLARVSAKKRKAAMAAGQVNPARPADTGFDRVTVEVVLQRDHWSCVRCGGGLHGERGRDWSIQHRRARGSGGTTRPDTNEPQNGLSVCGSGTTGCHGYIERERADARAHGWAIRQSQDPLLVPVQHAILGWVVLTADGGWSSRRSEVRP